MPGRQSQSLGQSSQRSHGKHLSKTPRETKSRHLDRQKLGRIMKYHIHTATGMIIKNKKLLVVRTPGQDFFKSAGGKLEPGESAEQAVIRELKEELEVKVTPDNLEVLGTFYVPAPGKGHEGETLR